MADYVDFDYMYRDASNYKAFGALLLTGGVNEDGLKRMVSTLDSGEFFIAEQIGIPALYEELWAFSDGPSEDDHVWHTFNQFRPPIEEEADLPVWGSVSDLIERFERIESWNEALSPHWDI